MKAPDVSTTSKVVPGGTSTFVYGTFFTQSSGICTASSASQLFEAWHIGAWDTTTRAAVGCGSGTAAGAWFVCPPVERGTLGVVVGACAGSEHAAPSGTIRMTMAVRMDRLLC